jgi:uncharacterized protein (DUF1501 family)
VIGERVAGGFHGEQPSLGNLKDDDLPVTTDFRSVYATVLEKVLATPAERIIGTWSSRLPLFRD